MAAIGAERPVVLFHGGGEPGGDGFMPQRQMRRALDQVLQEQIVGTLFDMADFQQRTPQREARFLANVVVFAFHRYFGFRHGFGLALGSLRFGCHLWPPLIRFPFVRHSREGGVSR